MVREWKAQTRNNEENIVGLNGLGSRNDAEGLIHFCQSNESLGKAISSKLFRQQLSWIFYQCETWILKNQEKKSIEVLQL